MAATRVEPRHYLTKTHASFWQVGADENQISLLDSAAVAGLETWVPCATLTVTRVDSAPAAIRRRFLWNTFTP